MQIFFKNRESARSVKSGKIKDNGKDSLKRWGRFVEAKPTTKEIMPLTCTKDHRYPEKAKSVQVLKVKKNKLHHKFCLTVNFNLCYHFIVDLIALSKVNQHTGIQNE